MPWPIDDPALAERLALPHAAFAELVDGFLAGVALPPFDEAFHQRAVTYPWARPTGSFVLRGDEVRSLDADHGVGGLTPAGGPAHPAGRVPLLAIGSNGAPSTLVRKLAHLPPTERDVAVVAGWLHGFDVGPAARITPYGALPATPFPSAGTAVRASVLWVTTAQLTALTWTELSYALGWLDALGGSTGAGGGQAAFEPDEPAEVTATPAVERALIYTSRWGTLCDADGAPLALAALRARGRTAAAWEQAALLELVAAEAGTAASDSRALHARLCADPRAFMRELAPWLAARAQPFVSPSWRALNSR